MSRIKRARPALVVVVVALIAAVAGTALAGSGPDANSSASLKQQVKKTKKKASKALKKAKANAAVLDACSSGASAAGSAATCPLPPGPTGPTGATGDTGATGPRGPSDLLVVSNASSNLTTCNGTDLGACASLLGLFLPAGNWLLQAKLAIVNTGGAAATSNRCGLAQGSTELDEVRHSLAANTNPGMTEAIATAAVVSGVAAGTLIQVRCNEPTGDSLQAQDIRLTALRVETVG